jgi:secreted PhoX family phosphatase
MGRFNHEAIAVSPNGRAVYLTEDRNDGVLYRYLPKEPGRLAAGGRLQALRVKGRPSLDTRNWIDLATEARAIERNEPLAVEWLDLDDVEAPEDDLRFRAFDAGAARFARGEGIWTGADEVYAACTSGGPARIGQIFRYRPSPNEGTDAEHDTPATLELFVEADEGGIIENCDNLTVAPWGELFVAEDGPPGNGLVRITPEGTVTRFAMNRLSGSELAGVCFSPDGRTMFVNIQQQGLTLAISGPFRGA